MITYLSETLTKYRNNKEGNNAVDAKAQTGKECYSCRIIAGAGLLGGGAYVAYEAAKRKSPLQKYAMIAAASGFLGLGVARVFNFPPFPYTVKG